MSTATPLPSSRNETVLEYYPLVRTIACRIARRLPGQQDVDEFINVGVLGLMDALDRYDPDRGVPLKAYAEIRIRGSIMDAVRAADWTPRSVRRKANRIEHARQRLRHAMSREPTPEELAHALDLSGEELESLRNEAQVPRLLSIDRPVGQEGTTPLAEQVASGEPDVEETWVAREIQAEAVNSIRSLPKKERVVITLYYLNGLTLKEIGEILGVTESRACQLRGQGVKRLKTRLQRSDG